MNDPTVPPTPPADEPTPRVALCDASINVDLDSLVVECWHRGYFVTWPTHTLDEAGAAAAFAAHRAACGARE